MHSRIVKAVAKISAQRQAPLNVRTRVTSASCKPPIPACGSSNSTRFAVGNSEAADDEADDMELSRQMIQTFWSLAFKRKLFFKTVRHVGLLQGRGTGLRPACEEFLVVGR